MRSKAPLFVLIAVCAVVASGGKVLGSVKQPLGASDLSSALDADLVALARELLHSPSWLIDAAQKLGLDNPFCAASPKLGSGFTSGLH
jgi:2,4-dienoyl-CoA reductase-like NADH-dependent reductase (Old Yellow Enzyme family)